MATTTKKTKTKQASKKTAIKQTKQAAPSKSGGADALAAYRAAIQNLQDAGKLMTGASKADDRFGARKDVRQALSKAVTLATQISEAVETPPTTLQG